MSGRGGSWDRASPLTMGVWGKVYAPSSGNCWYFSVKIFYFGVFGVQSECCTSEQLGCIDPPGSRNQNSKGLSKQEVGSAPQISINPHPTVICQHGACNYRVPTTFLPKAFHGCFAHCLASSTNSLIVRKRRSCTQTTHRSIFTARRSYASAVLGVVIPSVCLSHTCFVAKLNNALRTFWYHTKGQSVYTVSQKKSPPYNSL